MLNSGTTPPAGKSAVSLGRALQALALVLIVAFWARTLYIQWPYLWGYPWHLSWGYLLAALLLLLAQMLTLAMAWAYALALVGAVLPWRIGASMWLRAQMARYLPGGVWDIAGRMVLSRKLAMPTRAVPAAAALEISLQLLSATTVLVLMLLAFPTTRTLGYLPFALAALATLLVLLTPPVFQRGVNLALRAAARPPLPISLTYGHLVRLFAFYVLAHALQGTAFAVFVRGITPITPEQIPLLAGGYVAAWLVGYVAIFAPTGIGVREAALVVLLGGRIPAAAVIGSALGFRVWLSLRDVLSALVGMGLAVWPGEENRC